MAARADLRVAVVDVDRVPAGKALRDLVVGLIIRVAQGTQRLLGKDHSPAEGGIRWIALRNEHLVGRVGLLGQKGEVESRRPAADNGVAHGLSGSPRPAGRSGGVQAPWGTARAHRSRRLRSLE